MLFCNRLDRESRPPKTSIPDITHYGLLIFTAAFFFFLLLLHLAYLSSLFCLSNIPCCMLVGERMLWSIWLPLPAASFVHCWPRGTLPYEKPSSGESGIAVGCTLHTVHPERQPCLCSMLSFTCTSPSPSQPLHNIHSSGPVIPITLIDTLTYVTTDRMHLWLSPNSHNPPSLYPCQT